MSMCSAPRSGDRPRVACVLQRSQLRQGIQHRHEFVAHELRLAAGLDAVEDVDGGLRQPLAQSHAFAQRRDEEALAAFAREPSGDGFEAEAVGVRLDGRAALGRMRRRLQQLEVRSERVEIDVQHAAVELG